MKAYSLFLLLLIFVGWAHAKKPNFVFLVSEDNSIHYLKHYGAKFGRMPNVEKMAERGVTFNHAFSNAPVCSVARSTLATGILAPRGGFQYHRKAAPAQFCQRAFYRGPLSLRDAGILIVQTTVSRIIILNMMGQSPGISRVIRRVG